MGKPYYVKFETPADLVSPILEALRVAASSGKVKKGTNEATKAIERGSSKLIVIAEDVEPPEVVAHLPILCEEQDTPFVFVPTKRSEEHTSELHSQAYPVCRLLLENRKAHA